MKAKKKYFKTKKEAYKFIDNYENVFKGKFIIDVEKEIKGGYSVYYR